MERIIREILASVKPDGTLDPKDVDRILAVRNRQEAAPVRRFAKKHIMPYYLKTKSQDPARWESWNVTPAQEAALFATCRMKPRRTSSGVATITVITKPWKCGSNCLYCPNDIRMPKSYLSNEPACQRAERNFFDPYLQVASRLRALVNMGHETSKIELIILGGTFCDYPREYQTWFVQQLFIALNDGDAMEGNARAIRARYREAGLECEAGKLAEGALPWQSRIDAGEMTYNQAFDGLYRDNPAWQRASGWQRASMEDLRRAHRLNEESAHRVVGLVVETRPDTVTPQSLRTIRELGCTKVQMGIQSLDPAVLAMNKRSLGSADDAHDDAGTAARAIDLARLFGFKVHTHFMVNLLGSTPRSDMEEYRLFMTQPRYRPDEVKIYPCALVGGTDLQAHFENGEWRPYSEDELVDVLVHDVAATPEFTRISRMIRDISAQDILAGNKKGNLRQLVDQRVESAGFPVREIRAREINMSQADPGDLHLEEVRYETLHTSERFLQWVTPQNRIAGFLRLSLPHPDYVAEHPELAVEPGQAMIREVHVYGRAAHVGPDGTGAADNANAQHAGLGRKLVERACAIAREQGFRQMNVISSVGTRGYYRKLGFADGGLYQTREL